MLHFINDCVISWQVGADLVHVICSKPAATVIKSYSPELIVHPLLDEPNAIESISPWLDRLHVILIGPGLGRDTKVFEVVEELINVIKKKQLPLVIDADGLFLVTEKPELLHNFTSPVILTPNKIEFERLCNKLNGSSGLRDIGENVTVLRKGAIDELFSSDAKLEWKSATGGSGRRCGGQGDLLSGSISTFLHWTLSSDKIAYKESNKIMLASSLSCYAASTLVRSCNSKAFAEKGRSMLATDMISYIHESFTELYGE